MTLAIRRRRYTTKPRVAKRTLGNDAPSNKYTPKGYYTLNEFHWQQGYGAFSVSPSHVDALKEYIAHQEEHHRRESFQGEFRRLCKKYGLEIDERYVWD